MTVNSRKRSLLEMSACAVLVAALAVQPALGRDGKGKDRERDGGSGPQAAQTQSAAPAPAAAPAATAAPAARRAPARRGSNSGSRRSTRQIAAPTPAPAQAPAPTPPPVDPVPVDPPPPAVPPTTPGPEDGANGAPTPTSPAPATGETPTPAPTTPAPGQPTRTPTAAEAAVGATAPAPAATPGAVAADREAITTNAPLVTSQPPATTADAAPLSAPAADSTAANPAAGPTSPTSGRQTGSAQLRGTNAAGGTQPSTGNGVPPATNALTGGTAPATPLGEPLQTPATAAIARIGVREGQGIATSQPRATDGTVEPLGPPQTIASRIRDVVEVIPTWMWIALGGLGFLVLLLGAHALFAVARTRRLERQREKLMADIGLLQSALLPAVPSRMGALLTSVAYRPADGPAAGGDFYDAFALPDGKVGLLLGDVSGHGRQALAKTTLVRFTVRAHLEAGMSPREAISIAGRSLDGRLADDFATVLAAIHDPATGTLTYSSAGHPPPLVLGPSAHAPVTASSAPPIGAGFPTGQRQTMVPMPEGTTVAVYSDGLLEARIAGQPLGPERLAEWLAELGPEATAKQLLDLVVERADRVSDDLAAVILHAAPGATAPAARVEQLKLDVLDVEGPDLEGFLKAAGVPRSERAIAGRRVSEQLAITGGVIVEVRTGEHPTVSVYAIGERPTAAAPRQSTPAR
jgi:hypothetical protein